MKNDKPASPPKRNPDAFTVKLAKAEEVEPAVAALAVDPALNAASTTRRLNSPAPDNMSMDALVAELRMQAQAVNDGNLKRGEAMLTSQAHTLDAIFNICARQAALNAGEHLDAAETYYRVALRAQSQCRATWETLGQLKNPVPVAFVRQANIAAGPQQVNNGTAPASRPRESEFVQSKLLEAEHERMDARSAARTGRGNPAMAPVGEIDRTKDAGR